VLRVQRDQCNFGICAATTVGTTKFAGLAVRYTPARNAINPYRVVYPSVISELGNKPILASGLLAIPDTGLA
jgi:hypothetical protein